MLFLFDIYTHFCLKNVMKKLTNTKVNVNVYVMLLLQSGAFLHHVTYSTKTIILTSNDKKSIPKLRLTGYEHISR